MPKFDGEIRHYPQFKRDFQKHVIPTLHADDASYVLRSCLGKEPADTVKSVDDDIEEMWKRLDDKYGDPAKVADVIIDAIQRTRAIKEGEDKQLVEFIDALEDGCRDLKRLGLEAEITTTSSLQRIPSLCFIAKDKAKAENLKGTDVELSSTKVGGNNEKITSKRFMLTLVDQQGQEVKFEMYGIDKITSDIQSIDIDGVTGLFKNIPKEDIMRPTGVVDVLIGYEYADFHPQKEQSSGHLLLLENRFGR
ncbi:hypothetical protein OS493_019513 [Desmophyllum pertusum]|uniref:Uncharacterized protein n=1 Tax=Desmophyllum pertusum TaxID=174260 RepID=A0A9X0D344_9CNID|nr:hypothetical protein OS493_019513 [Desmophyllum pertusum]